MLPTLEALLWFGNLELQTFCSKLRGDLNISKPWCRGQREGWRQSYEVQQGLFFNVTQFRFPFFLSSLGGVEYLPPTHPFLPLFLAPPLPSFFPTPPSLLFLTAIC